MTVRDSITAALVAALAGAAAEFEVEPIGDPSRFPALSIEFGGQVVLEREAGATRYQLGVSVEGFVEGEGGAAPTAELNALHADVVRRIMADETLGGTVELVEDDECRFFKATLASVRRLGFAQDFAIQFVTRRGDPALPA